MKKVNRALWTLNGLLGAALLAFGWRCLLFPPKIDRLIGVDPSLAAPTPGGPAPAPSDESVLVTLRNPMHQAGTTPPPPFQAILTGALPACDDAEGIAFVKWGASETIARVGEEIRKDGKTVHEFRGWRLEELWRDGAAFRNARGERFELTIGSTHEEMPARARAGEAYHPEIYKSRRLAATESREVWGIDQDEVDWAAQNAETFLDRDAQVSLFSGGGLRIETLSPGSMAAARGLKPGDVLREVNGRPLHTLADLRSLFSVAAMSALQLTVDRAGTPLKIEYRLLPR